MLAILALALAALIFAAAVVMVRDAIVNGDTFATLWVCCGGLEAAMKLVAQLAAPALEAVASLND